MQRAATRCNFLQRAATCCNALQRAATRCNTLQHAATHYNRVQVEKIPTEMRLFIPCNTLQHTATHCNTLQHTATCCHNLHHTHTATHCKLKHSSFPIAIAKQTNFFQGSLPVLMIVEMIVLMIVEMIRMIVEMIRNALATHPDSFRVDSLKNIYSLFCNGRLPYKTTSHLHKSIQNSALKRPIYSKSFQQWRPIPTHFG